MARALRSEYSLEQVHVLPRKIYEKWAGRDAEKDILHFFKARLDGTPATVFVTAGVLDPNRPQEEIMRVNYSLSKNLVDSSAALGVRVVTFGTVMEGPGLSRNPYINSKILLGNHVAGVASRGDLAIHLRLHTHYGLGEPSPFMFLGQILDSIRFGREFHMSSGAQLREFHHLADETLAIRATLDSAVTGVFTVSHGNPITLRTVAETVYAAFNRNDLLKVNMFPDPKGENYSQKFLQAQQIQGVAFRPALPGIVAYLRAIQ